MQINMGEPFHHFDRRQVSRIQKDALYVGDLAIRGRDGGWTSLPASIFYTATPNPGYSNNYFGLFPVLEKGSFDKRVWRIVDATCVAEHVWEGIEKDGEVIFSRWRHDFRSFSFGRVSIDGGPDYTRIVGDFEGCKRVNLQLRNGLFQVI